MYTLSHYIHYTYRYTKRKKEAESKTLHYNVPHFAQYGIKNCEIVLQELNTYADNSRLIAF